MEKTLCNCLSRGLLYELCLQKSGQTFLKTANKYRQHSTFLTPQHKSLSEKRLKKTVYNNYNNTIIRNAKKKNKLLNNKYKVGGYLVLNSF